MKQEKLKTRLFFRFQYLAVLLLLILSSISSSLFAQYEDAKHGFGYRWNFINHEYPFNKQLAGNDLHTSGVEIAYQYHLHPNFNLAIPLKFGLADYYEQDGLNIDPEKDSYLALDALIHAKFFKESALFSPYVLAGIGVNIEQFKNPSAHIPVGLGLNIRLAKHFYISLQSEYRHSFKPLRHNLTHGIGGLLLLNPQKWKKKKKVTIPLTDQDGDGIADNQDKCPQVAGLAMYGGCPDTDKDSTPDHKDQCPDTPGPRDNGGCPYNSHDEDNDGIPDSEDRCPNLPGTAALSGCPDTDKDGIIEPEDECPTVFGLPKFRGCPDKDGDGIPEPKDKCPTEVGTLDNYGCPEIAVADQEILDFAVQAVEFETSKALLKTESYPVLGQIATIMNKYRAYHLTISGHTDSVGDSQSNKTLSEKRAKACYEYLLKKGIPANRMNYVGFGESQPIADNINMAGRQKNRRVEFTLAIR